MTSRIYSPVGSVGADGISLATLPARLAGSRCAVLDNGKPGAEALLRVAADRLMARTGVIVAGARQKGSAATPCEDALLDELISSADIVLTGTAD